MRYAIAIIIFVVICLFSTPVWAVGNDNTPNPAPAAGPVSPPAGGNWKPASAPATGIFSSTGPQGPRGEKGETGPPPSQDQILETLKAFEAAKEKGYKVPKSFEALIAEATSRKIIVGFATSHGVDYKWGRDVQRAEMAQFAGRLLKVIDELAASSAQRDEKLSNELSSLKAQLEGAQKSLESQLAAEARERQAADQKIWEAINRWLPGWIILLIVLTIVVVGTLVISYIISLGWALIILNS